MNLIGLQIKAIREQQALSQKDLAARCNVLGWDISRGTLAKIESQVRRVTDYEAVLLAQALRVPLIELFLGASASMAVELCREPS